jgi:hypothetical protein
VLQENRDSEDSPIRAGTSRIALAERSPIQPVGDPKSRTQPGNRFFWAWNGWARILARLTGEGHDSHNGYLDPRERA